MGLFTDPVTDAERRQWQAHQYETLGMLLKVGRRKDLPVVRWSVSEHALVGEALQSDWADRRGVFEAWVAALGLDRQDDRKTGTGLVHLQASVSGWGGRRGTVVVMADIFSEEPADG
jgi:hypothetical protein